MNTEKITVEFKITIGIKGHTIELTRQEAEGLSQMLKDELKEGSPPPINYSSGVSAKDLIPKPIRTFPNAPTWGPGTGNPPVMCNQEEQ